MLPAVSFVHFTLIPVETPVRAAQEFGLVLCAVSIAVPGSLASLHMSHLDPLATSFLVEMTNTLVSVPIAATHHLTLAITALFGALWALGEVNAGPLVSQLHPSPAGRLL